jgi:D-lyxose ketol-isomerase
MRRSKLNSIITDAITYIEKKGLSLPPFAYWGPEEWKHIGSSSSEIVDNMLGWDVTDFGSGEYEKTGLLIFTFRNGNIRQKEKYPKPYSEKLLLVKNGQKLPYHFHWSKMEDIINRGGGDLELQVYNSGPQEKFADSDVILSVDGTRTTVKAGGIITLHPGQSVTFSSGQYHCWQGKADSPDGYVILFEVSTVNDDTTDNRFYDATNRLPDIVEDEPAKYLLFKDYRAYVTIA